MGKIKYTYSHFGPFLFQSKVDKDITDFLLQEGEKAHTSHNSKLAGHIQNQIAYPENELKKFYAMFAPYIETYREGHCEFHNLIKSVPIHVGAVDLWINYMKSGDFNPLHTHGYDISFVIFLDVPKEIHQEAQDYEGTAYKPGSISFEYGQPSRPQWSRVSLGYMPQAGDLFIFPALLQHWVAPFKSDVTRISVSGNLAITNKEEFPKGYF